MGPASGGENSKMGKGEFVNIKLGDRNLLVDGYHFISLPDY